MKKLRKQLALLMLGLGICFSGFSQIQIDQTDMPVGGTPYTIYVTSNVSGDYTSSGPNFSWDFTSLVPDSATELKYLPMDSVPAALVTAFNLFAGANPANLAISLGSATAEESPIAFEDGFSFYANNTTGFKNLGIGFLASGFPIPVKYDNPDVIFAFPLDYQDTYSSQSYMEINLPNYFFYSSLVNRSSEVDGWGTIALPNDTFDVLRVKSTVINNDSIFIDSLGFGFQLPEQTTYEYYWLAKTQGVPVLNVTESNFVATAQFTSYPVISTPEYSLFNESAQVFRSGNNELTIRLNIPVAGELKASLYDPLGREIETLYCDEPVSGQVELVKALKASQLKGVFYVKLQVDKQQITKTLIF